MLTARFYSKPHAGPVCNDKITTHKNPFYHREPEAVKNDGRGFAPKA